MCVKSVNKWKVLKNIEKSNKKLNINWLSKKNNLKLKYAIRSIKKLQNKRSKFVLNGTYYLIQIFR